MTIHDYTQACIDFANDTSSWGALDEYQFYTTTGNGWEESCDNAHGGLSVRWAFHRSADEIMASASEEYRAQIAEELRAAIDDGWQPDQLEALYGLLT